MTLQSANIQLYKASESEVQTPMKRKITQLSIIKLVKKTKQDVQESKQYMHALMEIVDVSQIIKNKEEETFRFTFARVLPIYTEIFRGHLHFFSFAVRSFLNFI